MSKVFSFKGVLSLGLSVSMLVLSSASLVLADVNGVYQPMGVNNTWNAVTPNPVSGYPTFNSSSDGYLGFNTTPTTTTSMPMNTGYASPIGGPSNSFTSPLASGTSGFAPLALRGRVATIPDGTTLMVSLDEPVNSLTANLGDPVSGKIENDVYVNDTVVIPQGSEVLGQVASVSKSGRVGKHGSIDIKFFSAKTPQGVAIPLRAMVATKDDTGILKGDTYVMDVAKGVGIAALGTGAGAAMGTAAGGLLGAAGTGALFGLGVGALAGGGYALARKGQDVVLPRGARLTLTTTQASTVSPN